MIDNRISGKSKAFDSSADLMSIMLGSDLFRNDHELIKDELVTFFLAGFKTI